MKKKTRIPKKTQNKVLLPVKRTTKVIIRSKIKIAS